MFTIIFRSSNHFSVLSWIGFVNGVAKGGEGSEELLT